MNEKAKLWLSLVMKSSFGIWDFHVLSAIT